MKKLCISLCLLGILLSFTSCRVNWFGEAVDAPWYVVAIPVLLLLAAAYLIVMSRTYICPACKTEFKPKWYQLSVCVHFMGKRLAKCPHCGRKGFCDSKK